MDPDLTEQRKIGRKTQEKWDIVKEREEERGEERSNKKGDE